MAITRTKTWIKEILTFADLNAEFDAIINGARNLISPLTDTLDMDGKEFILDEDGDTSIHASSDDVIDFKALSFDVLKVDGTTASSANGLTIASAAAANPVLVSTHGTADRGITFNNDQAEEILLLTPVATAVNEVTITNAATGVTGPIIAASGEEANVNLNIRSKGTGAVVIGDASGEEIAIFDDVATAVNELTITNAQTGNNPTIACTGESDIGITLQNQDAEPMLELDSVATSTNWVKVSSAAAGADATIIGAAAGADAGLTLQGKGTGTLKLGDASLIVPDSDGAAGNYIMVTDGSKVLSLASNVYGTGIATGTVIPLPRGHLAGLITSNGTDTTNDIDVSVGSCRDAADTCNIVVGAALGKQIDVVANTGGTAGSPTGGFPNALTLTNDTWYHVLLISDGTNVTAGFDTAATGTNLIADHSGGSGAALSGYTYYRRLGSVYYGTATINQYTQVGGYFVWSSLVDEAATDPSDNTANLIALRVPPDVRVWAHFNAEFEDASLGVVINFYEPDGDNSLPAQMNGLVNLRNSGTNSGAAGQFRLMTNTSKQVGYRASEATGDFEIGTVGWDDSRGRDD